MICLFDMVSTMANLRIDRTQQNQICTQYIIPWCHGNRLHTSERNRIGFYFGYEKMAQMFRCFVCVKHNCTKAKRITWIWLFMFSPLWHSWAEQFHICDAIKFKSMKKKCPHNAQYSLIEILNNETCTSCKTATKYAQISTLKSAKCDNIGSHRINRMSALRTRKYTGVMRDFNLFIQLSYALFHFVSSRFVWFGLAWCSTFFARSRCNETKERKKKKTEKENNDGNKERETTKANDVVRTKEARHTPYRSVPYAMKLD